MNLAIFGGTFDPIHNGHLDVARAARREYFLDRILFVPAAQPPHKPEGCSADYEHRYEMVRVACLEHPAFEPSRIEAPGRDRGGRSYTIHTIRSVAFHLTQHDRLFFLIGADAFSEVTTWYQWRQIVAKVEFIVVNRPGIDLDEARVPPWARIHWLRSVNSPISSSEIRRRLTTGQSIRGMAPPAVARYITRYQLYRPARRKPKPKAKPKRNTAPRARRRRRARV